MYVDKMTKDIVGVYFDFFGTLIDSRYTLTNIWSRIAKRLGVEISYDDPRIWEGIRIQEEENTRLGKFFFDFTKEERFRLYTYVLDAMGVEREGAEKAIPEEFEREFSIGTTFRLYPGCRETLEKIHDKDIKIGLITHASSKLCKTTMKRLGIFGLFDFFILSESVGYNKSQIEIYEIALSKMNTESPEKIMHVGDDLLLDVQMAQKVGMTPIFFDPQKRHAVDDIITISEFPDILKHL